MNTPVNLDWKSSLGNYFILFWALGTKSYEKGHFGVFFCFHSGSLNMNDTELNFNGLIKLNTDRPYFGNEPSFLGFIKHMRMDSSLDEL